VTVGGVTAGTVLAFVLIAGGIWYLLRRRRRRRQAPGTEDKPPSALYLTEQGNSRYSTTPWTPERDPDKRASVHVRTVSSLSLSFLGFGELTLSPLPRYAVVSLWCTVQDPPGPSTHSNVGSLSQLPGNPGATTSTRDSPENPRLGYSGRPEPVL
jgi:hypothetical protein